VLTAIFLMLSSRRLRDGVPVRVDAAVVVQAVARYLPLQLLARGLDAGELPGGAAGHAVPPVVPQQPGGRGDLDRVGAVLLLPGRLHAHAPALPGQELRLPADPLDADDPHRDARDPLVRDVDAVRLG